MLKIHLLSCILALPLVDSYVTYNSAVPQRKQIKWLKKLTVDICESPAGELSDEMIKEVPEVMRGWTSMKDTSAENAVAIENLVKRLVDESMAGNLKATPTTSDYNLMLESWAKSREGTFAAERCEQILTQMQERFEAGDANVQPNLSSFKIVIMAWRESRESFGSYRAQRILEWMIQLYKQGKNDLALPDSDCFDIVLQCWSRNSFEAAPRNAEKLLGVMEKLYEATQSSTLRPNTHSFNAVLGAWARSNDAKSWRRMCDILGFMEKLHYVEGNDRVKPDLVTYHIVLGALSRIIDSKDSAPVADSLLRSIEKRYKVDLLSWDPDTILFNSVMGCWAHSNSRGAYRKSRSILDRQLNMFSRGCKECRPDVFGYTSVLSSCASEPGDRKERSKAFNVALSTFQELTQQSEEFGMPNHVTYGTMMKACVRLLPKGNPERKKWSRQLFQESKEKGLVGDMVLSRFREAATPEDYKELMEGFSKRSLPEAWKRNVCEKSEYRRRVADKRKLLP